MSQSQILSLSWELGVEDEEPDTDAAPVTLPYKKVGATHPSQLQVTSYLNGNLAIQMAVSYTHLDVYKRQSHYYLSMSPFPLAAVSPLPVRLAACA